MSEDNGDLVCDGSEMPKLILEENIQQPSSKWATWIAVGNAVFWLTMLVITSAVEINLWGWPWRSISLCLAIAGVSLLVLHLVGSSSVNLHFPRTIRIKNGLITVTQRGGDECLPLNDCYWFRSFSYDNSVWFSWCGKSRIVIRKKGEYNAITCGMSKEMRSAWGSLLQQIDIPQGRPVTNMTRLGMTAGIFLGCVLAYQVASMVAGLNLVEQQIAAMRMYSWMFLPLIGGLYGAVLFGNDWFELNGKQPLYLMFNIFALPGILPAWGIVGSKNFVGAIGLAVLNGLIGVTIALHLSKLGEKRRLAYLLEEKKEGN